MLDAIRARLGGRQVSTPPIDFGKCAQDQNYASLVIDGGRTTTAQILADGVSATTGTQWNALYYSPTVDALQEMQIAPNSYDAQFGKSGGGAWFSRMSTMKSRIGLISALRHCPIHRA